MRKNRKKIVNEKISGLYSVIKLRDIGTILFDCIPDVWFTDENQDHCFWPPPKGKNVAIRALKQEVPDFTWETYECEVVKGGFATYSCGRTLVREKCLQMYNTSSADEHIEAAKFRRKHPGLSFLNAQSFEDVFTKKMSDNADENLQIKKRTSSAVNSSKDDVNIDSQDTTRKNTPISLIDDGHEHTAPTQLAPVVNQKTTEEISLRQSSPTSIEFSTVRCFGSDSERSIRMISSRSRTRSPRNNDRSPTDNSRIGKNLSRKKYPIRGRSTIQDTCSSTENSQVRKKNLLSRKNRRSGSRSASRSAKNSEIGKQSPTKTHQSRSRSGENSEIGGKSSLKKHRGRSRSASSSGEDSEIGEKSSRKKHQSRSRLASSSGENSEIGEKSSRKKHQSRSRSASSSGENSEIGEKSSRKKHQSHSPSASSSGKNSEIGEKSSGKKHQSRSRIASSSGENSEIGEKSSRKKHQSRSPSASSSGENSEIGEKSSRKKHHSRSCSASSSGEKSEIVEKSSRKKHRGRGRSASSSGENSEIGEKSAHKKHHSRSRSTINHSRISTEISKIGHSNASSKSHQSHRSLIGNSLQKQDEHLSIAAGHRSFTTVQHSPYKTLDNSFSNSCSPSCQSPLLLKILMKEVSDLSKTVCKYQHENNRRLTRMEVSINKTLVRMGDITRSNIIDPVDDSMDFSRRYSGENSRREGRRDVRRYSREDSRSEEREYRRGNINVPRPSRFHRCPKMPISSLNELSDVNQQFKNKDFFTFMVNQEKEFCMPSKNVSTNAVITVYLRRFVSLRVRVLLTLKELRDGEGFTLFADFHNVYKFLIRLMLDAYKSCKKSLKEKEAHEALRIVWGRSKQLRADEKNKRITLNYYQNHHILYKNHFTFAKKIVLT